MTPRKIPKGEKPADTIRFQASQIAMLTARCDELSVARGKAEAERTTADREKREYSARLDRAIAETGRLSEKLGEVERDRCRLQGYIDRVRDAEHPLRAVTDPGNVHPMGFGR